MGEEMKQARIMDMTTIADQACVGHREVRKSNPSWLALLCLREITQENL